MHHIRERLGSNKVALSNQSIGLLSEFGVVFPTDHAVLIRGLTNVIMETERSQRLRDMVIDMLSEYKAIVERLKGIEKQ